MSIPALTIDGWTLGVALVVVLIKIGFRFHKGIKPYASATTCGKDLLDGAVLVPFGLMLFAVFYPEMHTVSLSTALAGGVGLFFVLGEILSLGDSRAQ